MGPSGGDLATIEFAALLGQELRIPGLTCIHLGRLRVRQHDGGRLAHGWI